MTWQREVLIQLEGSLDSDDDVAAALALVAAEELELDEATLNAAKRRALFVLAAGGDPSRALDTDSRAVSGLAAELGELIPPGRLSSSLRALLIATDGLPRVDRVLRDLLASEPASHRALAVALLAGELAEDGEIPR